MAHHHEPSILLPLLFITLFLMSGREVLASRRLSETALPAAPDQLPKVELPPLPKAELPPLPHLPALQEPKLPSLPKLEAPKFPELPRLPHLPDLPKPTLPTIPTLPKDIPFPSLSPPHSTSTTP